MSNVDVREIPVPITKGGTGQTSKTPAFDALAPCTTQGDLIYYDGSDNIRLAKGTAGQVLKMNAGATAPAWGSSKSMMLFGGGAVGAGHSPLDATSYYMSASFGFDPGTADATAGIIMPACTVTAAYITVSVFGTGGSAGNTTFLLRKNSTTETTISAAVTFSSGVNNAQNTALSFSLSDGDRFYVKFTTPTWATNPTVVFYAVSLVVEFP